METSVRSANQSKVPELTLLFCIIKIAATTLGETGGDAVSMSMNLGYLVGTAIFAVIFVAAVWRQIRTVKFHPAIYWFTTLADWVTLDRIDISQRNNRFPFCNFGR